MAKTTVRLIGDLRLHRTLAHARDKIRDMRGAFEQVRADFLAVERGRYGVGAPALSPAYATWKAAHYPGSGPLVLTGRLRGAAEGGRDFSAILRPLSLRMVISTPYAIFHAKQVLPLERADLERWVRLVDGYLAKAVKG